MATQSTPIGQGEGDALALAEALEILQRNLAIMTNPEFSYQFSEAERRIVRADIGVIKGGGMFRVDMCVEAIRVVCEYHPAIPRSWRALVVFWSWVGTIFRYGAPVCGLIVFLYGFLTWHWQLSQWSLILVVALTWGGRTIGGRIHRVTLEVIADVIISIAKKNGAFRNEMIERGILTYDL